MRAATIDPRAPRAVRASLSSLAAVVAPRFAALLSANVFFGRGTRLGPTTVPR